MQHPVRQLTSAQTEGDTHRVLAKLEATGKDIPIIGVVANWPQGFRPFVLMADALLSKGSLTPRTRELVVLHIAARLGLTYEWDEHARISIAAGVTDAERSALSGGDLPADGICSAAELAALRFADLLMDAAALQADEWDRACDELGEDAAFELVFAVAWWGGFVPVVAQNLVALSLGAH
jgi:alkylhydroperoxidase/carboxymuconolactone decarboxylase family protein YurZ